MAEIITVRAMLVLSYLCNTNATSIAIQKYIQATITAPGSILLGSLTKLVVLRPGTLLKIKSVANHIIGAEKSESIIVRTTVRNIIIEIIYHKIMVKEERTRMKMRTVTIFRKLPVVTSC
jgi:hypothetical protein